jgi:hypothetical protein
MFSGYKHWMVSCIGQLAARWLLRLGFVREENDRKQREMSGALQQSRTAGFMRSNPTDGDVVNNNSHAMGRRQTARARIGTGGSWSS